MKFDNSQHLVDVPTNIGTITFIETVRKNRPKGLRKPYEYILPLAKAKELFEKLKKYLKSKEKQYQCAGVNKKSTTKGIKLDIFVLGYKPGLCGPNDGCDGVAPQEWQQDCKFIQKTLFEYLGKDASIYADPFRENDKFQARFETYIAYEELL